MRHMTEFSTKKYIKILMCHELQGPSRLKFWWFTLELKLWYKIYGHHGNNSVQCLLKPVGFFDILSISALPNWYAKYITLYRYIIFNVTFTFWKPGNDYKRVMPGILCEKSDSTKKKLACSPFPCYIKGISRYSSNTFVAADCQFFIKTIIWLVNLIIKSPKTVYTKLYLKKRYKDVEIWWNKLKYNFTSHMVRNLFKKDDWR